MAKRFVVAAMIIMLVVVLGFSPAMAKNPKENGPKDTAKKYFIGHLYLFQKDPSSWERIPDGAWGKMTYKLWYSKFWFEFNGHDLIPGEGYTLIYYPDPWPGEGLIKLGTGIANDGGNVHIKGRLEDVCDLPADYDENFGYGAKIWLVLSSDVEIEGEANKMIGWNPLEYLFEYHLITFDNTDCEYEAPPAEETIDLQ